MTIIVETIRGAQSEKMRHMWYKSRQEIYTFRVAWDCTPHRSLVMITDKILC